MIDVTKGLIKEVNMKIKRVRKLTKANFRFGPGDNFSII